MAYQDDFRNKVLAALKAKNLAVDISQEATQQAIVEEAQNVAASEPTPMSPEDMKLILQDVAKQLAIENQQLAIENQKLAAQNQAFSAQSSDFTAFTATFQKKNRRRTKFCAVGLRVQGAQEASPP